MGQTTQKYLLEKFSAKIFLIDTPLPRFRVWPSLANLQKIDIHPVQLCYWHCLA